LEDAETSLQRHSLTEAEHKAFAGYRRYLISDPEAAGKFRLLQLRILVDQGNYLAVLNMIHNSPPQVFATCALAVRSRLLAAVADYNLPPPFFDDKDGNIHQAEEPCEGADPLLPADVATRRGQVFDEGAASLADFRTALAIARQQHDTFREASALLDLSHETLLQEHYDDSVAWCHAAIDLATRSGYRLLQERAEGNLARVLFKLGDFKQSAELFRQAQQTAHSFGAFSDQTYLSHELGLVQEKTGEFALAKRAYESALETSQRQGNKDQASAALNELAFLSIRTADWNEAQRFSVAAFQSAHEDQDRPLELEAWMAQGLVASHRGDLPVAEKVLQQVAVDPNHDRQSLRWEAQAALADVYAKEQKSQAASSEYRTALDTAAKARCTIEHQDLRLSFQATASSIYDRYIDYLVQQGRPAQALAVADQSRALTLAESLGIGGKKCLASEAAFDPQSLARRARATILVYWLGAERSYLWAIDGGRMQLFPLPPASEIETAVDAYSQALVGPWDVLQTRNKHGQYLYRTLVAPASAFFHPGGRVIVVADGALSGLGFDSLPVIEPPGKSRSHYWIEDVIVENASSLRLLAQTSERKPALARGLLLMGNPLPVPEFPALPHAAEEIERVEASFAQRNRQVFEQAAATGGSYLASHPEQFAEIHFVAHGSASLSDPLDSAVILSPAAPGPAAPSSSAPSSSAPVSSAPVSSAPVSSPPGASSSDASHKLYARDIVAHPIHARLVTISACSSAGKRIFKGEGLIGLSWAFLGAGAHNVIGSLWDISDESSPDLMAVLYSELQKGTPPDAALRAAKLSLLHSSKVFHKPIYWAAFQLYTRS
jgi:CHAT domain-containing protein